jgi:hypothetical protein
VTAPKVVSTAAKAYLVCSLDVHVEPGSVPDRPVPYDVHATFRPDRLRLSFQVSAEHDQLGMLSAAAVRPDFAARGEAAASGVVLYGLRLHDDGHPGDRKVTEHFRVPAERAPGWVQEIIASTLAGLTGGPS